MSMIRRILAIDGGGIKGVAPLAFLAAIERALGRPIGCFFDLIVGTSTGGIIALGLGLGFKAQDLLRFYEELAGTIFSGNRVLRLARWLGFSKYSAEPLRAALTEKFGTSVLGDSKTRLVIPSLDLDTGKVHIFKTAHHQRFEVDHVRSVVDVALATAAAPSYFPTHILEPGTPLIDGGVWAINPTGVAVVEAIGVLGWRAPALRVLSLGCTTAPFDPRRGRFLGNGALHWAFRIAELFLTAQSSASLGTAHVLAGRENVFRYSPVVPPGRYGLDSIAEIPSLRGLGEAEAREALPQLRPVFFEACAEPFVPLRTPPCAAPAT
jgi:hypothetical protein